jgi:DNA polymerase kappa
MNGNFSRNEHEERTSSNSKCTTSINDKNIITSQSTQNQKSIVKTNETFREASALLVAASDKAGMQGIDRSRIDAIILRESGNSSYMKYQRKQDEHVNQRIATMKVQVEQRKKQIKSNNWKQTIEKSLEGETHNAIQSRLTRSTCCVVDMDMFYMACELLSKPEYSEKPCCVGGNLISTSNYVARKYGVRAAMAGFIADKLVHELSNGNESLIHFSSNFSLYTEKATQVRNALREYDPKLKTYSLDEAYLDLGPYISLWLKGKVHHEIVDTLNDLTTSQKSASPKTMAETIIWEDPLAEYSSAVALEAAATVLQGMRQRVFHATGGLTCSAGLAPNFMLAKIASDQNKPNGQKIVGPTHSEVLSFLHPLSTRKIPGIGRVTEKLLHSLDISTVQHLYNHRALVQLAFPPVTARFLLLASVGCTSSRMNEMTTHKKENIDDDDNVDTNHLENNDETRKGMSRERTFSSGVSWPEILTILEHLAQRLSQDLKSKLRCARTLTFKVKLKSFDVMSRSRSMPSGCYLQTADELMTLASSLLYEWKASGKYSSTSIRLLGIRCSNFCTEADKVATSRQSIEHYMQKQTSKMEDSTTVDRPISTISTIKSSSILKYTTNSNSPMDGVQQKALENIESLHKQQPFPHENESLSCPICGIQFIHPYSNESVNHHIDDCLNRPLLENNSSPSDIQEYHDVTRKKKRQKLEDFFPLMNRKVS